MALPYCFQRAVKNGGLALIKRGKTQQRPVTIRTSAKKIRTNFLSPRQKPARLAAHSDP
jgi:hypothetical protein